MRVTSITPPLLELLRSIRRKELEKNHTDGRQDGTLGKEAATDGIGKNRVFGGM